MELAVIYYADEINQKIPFPVIVERWEKKNFGQGKREYYKEFNDKERRTLAAYYPRFYKWYLVKGTPEKCAFAMKNLELLNRAGNFFASI